MFTKRYPDYKGTISSEELCVVSDQDVPKGCGGINREAYTYGELRHQPIIPEVMQLIQNPKLRQFAMACNERNREKGFQMYKINGEYCFWGLRVGPVVEAPTVEELKKIIGSTDKGAEALKNKLVNARAVRDISYNLLRLKISELCGMSLKEAELAIGNQLDCVPHEDEAGLIYMVPNWAHRWFKHDGYVSKMLIELNK